MWKPAGRCIGKAAPQEQTGDDRMTDRLYYADAYLTDFDGRVDQVREGDWVALNRSAFYPTSGGQPFDTGVLAWAGGQARVLDVTVEEGVVWHRVSVLPPAGAASPSDRCGVHTISFHTVILLND